MRSAILSLVILGGLGLACSGSTTTANDAGSTDDGGADAVADAGPTPAATIVVNDFKYVPSKATVKVGDTVRWTFTKGTHSITSGSNCTTDASPELDSGEQDSPFTYEHTFTKAGTYPYYCTFMQHCAQFGQVGTITVTP